jgi:hypothetical protein
MNYGVYRLLLTQIVANHATNDTLFSADGKGDEVYVTANIDRMTSEPAIVTAQQSLRTWTFGDVNNQGDRVMAGSLSSQGGSESGDTIPPTGGACIPKAPDHLCLPMEIFRGRLVKDALGVYITPRIWEWDGPPSDLFVAPLDASHGQFVQKLSALVQTADQEATQMSTKQGGYFPPSFGQLFSIASPWVKLSTLIPGSTIYFVPGPLEMVADRPIGIHDALNGQISFDYPNGRISFEDNVIPLSYELAEGLWSQSIKFLGLGRGEFPMMFNDDNQYGGIYTLTFRVERCGATC